MSIEYNKQGDSELDRNTIPINSEDMHNIITAVNKIVNSSLRGTTNGGREWTILAPFYNTWIDSEQIPLFGRNYDEHRIVVSEARGNLIGISSELKRSSSTSPWRGAHTIIDYAISGEESNIIPFNGESDSENGTSSHEMMWPVATNKAVKYLGDCTTESIEDIAWNDDVLGVINRTIYAGYPVIMQTVTHATDVKMISELYYKDEKKKMSILFVAEVVPGNYIEMHARFDFTLNIVEDISVEAWIDREQYTTETPISMVRIGEFIGEKIAEMGY